MIFQEIMDFFLTHKINTTPQTHPLTCFLFETHRLPAGTAVLILPLGKVINLIKK